MYTYINPLTFKIVVAIITLALLLAVLVEAIAQTCLVIALITLLGSFFYLFVPITIEEAEADSTVQTKTRTRKQSKQSIQSSGIQKVDVGEGPPMKKVVAPAQEKVQLAKQEEQPLPPIVPPTPDTMPAQTESEDTIPDMPDEEFSLDAFAQIYNELHDSEGDINF